MSRLHQSVMCDTLCAFGYFSLGSSALLSSNGLRMKSLFCFVITAAEAVDGFISVHNKITKKGKKREKFRFLVPFCGW